MLFLKLGLMFTLPHSPAINYIRQHEPHTWQAEARACLRGSGILLLLKHKQEQQV